MALSRLDETKSIPGESRGEVHPLSEKNGPSCRGQEVAKHEFKRVCVLCSPANRHLVLMVDLVHVRVDRLVVQQTMAEMKSEVLEKHAEEDLGDHFGRIGDTFDAEVEHHFQIKGVERAVQERADYSGI